MKVFVSLLVFIGGMFQDQFLFPCPKIQQTILSVFVGVKAECKHTMEQFFLQLVGPWAGILYQESCCSDLPFECSSRSWNHSRSVQWRWHMMPTVSWTMWTSQFPAKVPNGDLFSFIAYHAEHLMSQGA